jgi:hypothetical protein
MLSESLPEPGDLRPDFGVEPSPEPAINQHGDERDGGI